MTTEFISEIKNPETYKEAMNSENSIHWKQAMDTEIESLQENQTWTLTTLPKDAKTIPSKWIFRVKTNPDGNIDKYKARFVIKGFNQRQGVDYNQTFSPVVKLSTIRSILSIAASKKMHLTQFDVSTAFLYGKLNETIYMQQPEGYNNRTNQVCKLRRSLYGLKQALRCWTKRIDDLLLKLGFKTSEADPCLYIRKRSKNLLLVVLYVDDGLVVATDLENSKILIEELKKEFKITTKPAPYFLELEIERNDDGAIKISQQAYTKKILQRFNMENSRPVSTPILKGSETQNPQKEM